MKYPTSYSPAVQQLNTGKYIQTHAGLSCADCACSHRHAAEYSTTTTGLSSADRKIKTPVHDAPDVPPAERQKKTATRAYNILSICTYILILSCTTGIGAKMTTVQTTMYICRDFLFLDLTRLCDISTTWHLATPKQQTANSKQPRKWAC